jgi:hypothetical protein
MEALRDYQAHIAQSMVLTRVDAPAQRFVTIPNPVVIPVQANYAAAPIPSLNVPSSNATAPTPSQSSSPQAPIRENATPASPITLQRQEPPSILSKSENKEAPKGSETQTHLTREATVEKPQIVEKPQEKQLEQKIDTLPKDPVQALEKALDSILKGYSSPAQTPTTQPESHITVTHTTQPTERTQAVAERHTVDKSAVNSPVNTTVEQPQATTPTEQSPKLPLTPATKAESSHVSERPSEKIDREVTMASKPAQVEHEHPRNSEQHEQHRQHRAEQIQIAQQIVATYLEQTNLVRLPHPVEQTQISIQPRHESTTVAVEKIRESVLDKLTAIQSQLETSSVERKRTEHTTPAQTLSIQGRQENITQAPIHHDRKPSLDLQYNDRSSPASQLTRLLREVAPAIAGFATPAAVASAQGQTPTSIIGARSSLDTLNALFDLLKRFSERSNNVRLLSRMDSPLEKACLSLVTGVALGVVGVEVLIRTANMALLEMLRALRESKKHNEACEDELPLQSQLDEELEAHIQKTFIEPIKAGFVADVSGTLVEVQSAAPIAGVLIGSRELGSTISDQNGRFLFKNVPLGTGYTLTLYHPLFKLTPREVHGVCSEHAHHRIELAKTPITPKASL